MPGVLNIRGETISVSDSSEWVSRGWGREEKDGGAAGGTTPAVQCSDQVLVQGNPTGSSGGVKLVRKRSRVHTASSGASSPFSLNAVCPSESLTHPRTGEREARGRECGGRGWSRECGRGREEEQEGEKENSGERKRGIEIGCDITSQCLCAGGDANVDVEAHAIKPWRRGERRAKPQEPTPPSKSR
eukprot:126430-Rhodomonas_salina.1